MNAMTENKEPRVCFCVPITAYVEGEGYRASVVREGEDGHYPTGDWPCGAWGVRPYFLGHEYDLALEKVKLMNLNMGISEKDADEIVSSSISLSMKTRMDNE